MEWGCSLILLKKILLFLSQGCSLKISLTNLKENTDDGVFFYKNCRLQVGNRMISEMLTFRGSHLRCSVKKGVLKNFAKFAGKGLCWNLFFNKAANLRPATLFKKRLQHRCFLVNFSKFSRRSFSQNTSGRLFLDFLCRTLQGDHFWILSMFAESNWKASAQWWMGYWKQGYDFRWNLTLYGNIVDLFQLFATIVKVFIFDGHLGPIHLKGFNSN